MDLKKRYLFEVNSLKGNLKNGEERYEDMLFSPASLDISSDEWKELANIDADLASQIGCILLERQKDLNMLITSTESCVEEQTLRADYYENQIKTLRESFDAQSQVYESFEIQLEELTRNYRKLQDECCQYKRQNRELWKSIETLEKTCDEYLEEILLVKSKQSFEQNSVSLSSTQESDDVVNQDITDHLNHKNIEVETNDSDIISLKIFSEETLRKLELEKSQRAALEHRLRKLLVENKDQQSQIHWLEYRLVHDDDHDGNEFQQSSSTNMTSKCKSLYNLSSIDEELSDADTEKTIHLRVPLFSPPAVDFEKGLLISSEKKTSSPLEELTSPKSQLLCARCGQLKNYSFDENKRVSPDNSKTLSNYKIMFEEIFQKLKLSREINENNI